MTAADIAEITTMLKTLTTDQIRLMLRENQKIGHKHGGAVARRCVIVAQLINAEVRARLEARA